MYVGLDRPRAIVIEVVLDTGGDDLAGPSQRSIGHCAEWRTKKYNSQRE